MSIDVRRRLPRDLLWMAGIFMVYLALHVTWFGLGVDSHAYWAAWRGPMYDGAPATHDAFLYSPAFAQAIWPLAQLPWPVFGVLWSVAACVALWWLVRTCDWYVAVPLMMVGVHEVISGNVNWIMALVAVFGLRYPAAWVFPALTKVIPCVGPVWFLARGEWRKLAVSTLGIAIVTAVSMAVSPELWGEWLRFMQLNAESSDDRVGGSVLPPLIYRLPVLVALTIWGARTNRPWVIPVAMVLASPVVGPGQFVLLLALPRINAAARSARKSSEAPSDTPDSVESPAGTAPQRLAGTRELKSSTTASPS